MTFFEPGQLLWGTTNNSVLEYRIQKVTPKTVMLEQKVEGVWGPAKRRKIRWREDGTVYLYTENGFVYSGYPTAFVEHTNWLREFCEQQRRKQ